MRRRLYGFHGGDAALDVRQHELGFSMGMARTWGSAYIGRRRGEHAELQRYGAARAVSPDGVWLRHELEVGDGLWCGSWPASERGSGSRPVPVDWASPGGRKEGERPAGGEGG